MNKQRYKTPEFWISFAGLAALASVFLLWLVQTDITASGLAAAILSTVLFAAVCLRFVPQWMRFWQNQPDTADKQPGNVPKTEIRIFTALLLLSFGFILAAFLLRRLMGYNETFLESLSFWTCTDSKHYLDIARDWYLSEGELDRLVQLVFLPGYPIVVRLVNLIIGNYLYSGLLISSFSFAGAGCIIYKLVCLDYSHRTALRTVKYLCLLPGVFFFAAPMSESLFLLLCAVCIYCARTRRWLSGCIFGALAAFTRSLGVTLFVPLFFEAISEFAHERSTLSARLAWKRLAERLAALPIILVGFAAYCAINYFVSGDPFKFMQYQREHWGQQLGWFFNTAAYQTELAIACIGKDRSTLLGLWLPNLAACFGSLLAMFAAGKKMRPSYTAWFIVYYVVAVGATWLLSAPRYLIALIPVPIAFSLASDKPEYDIAISVVCAAAGILYFFAFLLRWQVW